MRQYGTLPRYRNSNSMPSANTSRVSSPVSAVTSSTPPTTRSENEVPELVRYFKAQSHAERFTKWRPSYHLQAPYGWMNDPCAPGYNPKTGLYHVSFQWNPHGNDWGNISWCSATSPDLINWTVDSTPSLSPDQPYDQEAVFTGCLVHGKDGSMNYLHTSASSLPIHYTLPYVKGCESLSIATSHDNGKTWTKSPQNPILPSAPAAYDVTGWRDPYVAQWPSMGNVLGLSNDNTLFGVISGGIRGVTPTTFLYTVDADDLTRWEFVSPIVNVGLGIGTDRWSGDLGKNWEVTNFCTLKDEIDPTVERDFLIMGTEGYSNNSPETAGTLSDGFRPYRNQLWTAVTPRKTANGATLSMDFGGVVDHGCLYAANSFYDPVSQRQVVWGWIPEDDLSDELRQPQGWSGMMSLPRELHIQTIEHVVGASASDLKSISSIELEPDSFGSCTVRTLASQPCPTIVNSIRSGPNVRRQELQNAYLGTKSNVELAIEGCRSLQWEIECSLKLSRSCQTVGIRVFDIEGQSTTLEFSPQLEAFTIHRPTMPESDCSELINSNPESASHTLFRARNSITGEETVESLKIRAWRDNSVLEVFVNGRTAISTRLYAAGATSRLQFFGHDFGSRESKGERVDGNSNELEYATLWHGIGVNVDRQNG